MHVFEAWTLESFAFRVVANNVRCRCANAHPFSCNKQPVALTLTFSCSCQQSFFWIILNESILPSHLFEQLILRSPRQELPGDDRGTNPPAVAGRLFCWTIRPGQLSLPPLRVYVHPWSGKVSFRFLPCSCYLNSRKCVHTLQTDLTRNPFSRTNTTPTHT